MTFKTVATLLLLTLVTACDRSSDRMVYSAQGIVVRTYPGEARIQIAHDKIAGYMEAMTMDFDVKRAEVLAGLNPGDRVRFDLVVTSDDGWIENLRRMRDPKGDPAREPLLAKTALALWTPPLRIGEAIPDITFTNELGQSVKLSDYRGHALALSFIFTRCPFPDYCPRMTKQLAQVRESMTLIPNAPTNWHLFSISFDPEFDQPSVLLDYRHNLKIPNDDRWHFLSGEPKDIKNFCASFGVYFMRDRSTIDHNLVTAVIDTQGRLFRLFPGNKWDANELIDELASAAVLGPPKALAVR